MRRRAGVRMCMQKCAVPPPLTPNQRQTCVASRCKSSFTWNISVRGHWVMTAPSSHTELTLPSSSSSSSASLSFHHSPSRLLIWSCPTWEWGAPFVERRSWGAVRQTGTEFLWSNITCLSQRRCNFPHWTVAQPLISRWCAYLEEGIDSTAPLHWEARLS